ncbi:hypothetical protein FAVG1_02434 [Fusarium avenaceum]|nr:hypothetical protein FAVG1_02434 [Fusarium avenaceum]
MDAVSKSLVSLRIDKDEDCPSYVHSARLYVVADQTARPGFYHWSFKIYNEKTEKWTTYEVRKSPADKYPVKHVHDAVPGTTGLDFRLFELVSIPCHWLPEVYKACESARVPGVGGKRCSHVYVRYIVDCLKKAGIVGESQVTDLLSEIERIEECDDSQRET